MEEIKNSGLIVFQFSVFISFFLFGRSKIGKKFVSLQLEINPYCLTYRQKQTGNPQYIMAKKDNELTPMMKQFMSLKAKHPDALLLFRCGDFYETYLQDAIDASKILGITLTNF